MDGETLVQIMLTGRNLLYHDVKTAAADPLATAEWRNRSQLQLKGAE